MSKRDTRTEAQKQRALKQDELRRLLSERCRIQHVIENIEKIEDVSGKNDPNNATMEAAEVNRLVKANEQRIRLLNKYLPDLKSIELANNPDNPLFESDEQSLIRRLESLTQSAERAASGSDKHH